MPAHDADGVTTVSAPSKTRATPPREGRALGEVLARVEVHLATARLLEWEVDLATEPLQQPHHRAAGVGKERVVEAGDEEARAHGSVSTADSSAA